MSSSSALAMMELARTGERAVARSSNRNRNNNPRPPQAGD